VGPIEQSKDLWGSVRPRHTPDHAAEQSLIPLPIPSHDALRLLKSAVHTFVAEGQTLDDPSDLTDKTTAQTDFYTHRALDEQASSIRPGALTPDTPPRSRPQEHGWTRGAAWEDERKIFCAT
jgi:hypothetical protein